LRLFSDNVFFCSLFLPSPPLFSVVVLYTQGVESKQWREVRDHSRPSVNTTQSPCLLSMTAHSLFTTLSPLLSLKVNAVSANHLQLIYPANIRVLVSTVLDVRDWVMKVTATRIDKDLPLRQSPPWLLATEP